MCISVSVSLFLIRCSFTQKCLEITHKRLICEHLKAICTSKSLKHLMHSSDRSHLFPFIDKMRHFKAVSYKPFLFYSFCYATSSACMLNFFSETCIGIYVGNILVNCIEVCFQILIYTYSKFQYS